MTEPQALSENMQPNVEARDGDEVATMLAEAAAWVVRLAEDQASDGDRRDFELWRAQSPVHARAFAAMARQALAVLPDMPAVSALAVRRPARRPVQRYAMAASVAALALAVGVVALDRFQDELLGDTYRTAAGVIETVRLADGSEVTMNGGTRLLVRYTATRRSLQLREGEALFIVAPDKARPFRVAAGARTVEAVGTAFDVDRRGDWVGVAVSHGVVALSAPREAALHLEEGKATAWRGDAAPDPVREVAVADVAAWQRKELSYYRVPLAVVLDALERHYGEKFEADPALAARNVSILMQLGQRDAAVKLLANLQSLRAVRVDATTVRFEDAARRN